MTQEQEGFQVNEAVEMPDLGDIKEQRFLLPVAKDVLFRIMGGSIWTSKEKDSKALQIKIQVVEGLPVIEEGETVMKYAGSVFQTGVGPMALCIWADKTVGNRPNSDWWKNDQHLVAFKQFCMALEIPLAGIKVDDSFLENLKDREIRASISHDPETVVDAEGKRQATGTMRHTFKFWKKA